jgi:hypothetical protein
MGQIYVFTRPLHPDGWKWRKLWPRDAANYFRSLGSQETVSQDYFKLAFLKGTAALNPFRADEL